MTGPVRGSSRWASGVLIGLTAATLVAAQSTTNCSDNLPTTAYAPFQYSACSKCPTATITDTRQTITVIPDILQNIPYDNCVIAFRDWVFQPTRTVTCYLSATSGAGGAAGGQATPYVERWSVGSTYTSMIGSYIASPTCVTLPGGVTISVPFAPTVLSYVSTQVSTGVTQTFRT